ncbi:RluA family pseudouridine synthase [Mangrovimonas aestuarii]|uniref:RluA family pseudouridine synthase n=1 Tax=Mangrovimonas aestuarii TaxID=3018443 RepID=UPI0023780435|nr:RluA family pseudouridine synthase [Mangrovimonas aestuarii]
MSQYCTSLFHPFANTSEVTLPERFTFPFYYEPHALSMQAAEDLQAYLETQTEFEHNFGLDPNAAGLPIGKMFGVMVVKNSHGELGYLAAFSGKLADSNDLAGFVPPIYNTLNQEGFYKKGEAKLNAFNREIEALENCNSIQQAKVALETCKASSESDISAFKTIVKKAKQERKQQREAAKDTLTAAEFEALEESLKSQSISYHMRLKHLKREWDEKIHQAEATLKVAMQPLEDLKIERAMLSASLQKGLHEQYKFLNAEGKTKHLLDIFNSATFPIPPAGAGECAAPKLFQYAYQNGLRPIAMAEFWWGASPKSQVRKHKQFYPSCRSKCEPILGHMMQGLLVEDNPIEQAIVSPKNLEVIFEDEHLLLINKPHEFLSVPGRNVEESVQSRMRQYIPNAKGPLLVHRLDMSTSGLLLVAKNQRIHKQLQKQFIERSVQKRYVALLDGILPEKEGTIELPLRVDFHNRPQQLVCYEHGKHAKTKYKVISEENGKTRVYFYPVTGRTHQLRVHAAHSNGLKTPIVGDDLYGTKTNRLHLHAEQLCFTHPITKQEMTVQCKVPF